MITWLRFGNQARLTPFSIPDLATNCTPRPIMLGGCFFFLQERGRKTTDNIKLYEIKAVVKRFIKGEIFCETQNNIISRKDTKTTEK